MNGAIAVPWLNIKRPPNRTVTIMTGSSQYFLRSRRNPQNSAKNAIRFAPRSVLVLHRFAGGPRRISMVPVGRHASPPQLQTVFAAQSRYPSHRHDNTKEGDRKDSRRYDPIEQQTQPKPQQIQRPQ